MGWNERSCFGRLEYKETKTIKDRTRRSEQEDDNVRFSEDRLDNDLRLRVEGREDEGISERQDQWEETREETTRRTSLLRLSTLSISKDQR